MKKLLLATALLAAYSSQAQTPTYTQVPVTGFNADIIANGSGTAMSSTNNDADGLTVFAAQNFVNPSNQTPGANTALPNNGLITSAVTTTPGLTFQLAPYTGNNVLRVAGNTSGTLTFTTPISATDLYVLLTPVNYSGTMPVTFTVNFTDATSQVFSGTTITYNWYASSGFAWGGTTRVNRSTSALDVQSIGPRIFQHKLTLSTANASKSIQSIVVNNGSAASTNNMIHVMAVTAVASASTLATDAGIVAITNPNSGCILTSQETITVTVKNFGTTPQSNIPVSYTLNSGAPVNEIMAGPIPPNSTATYSFGARANFSTAGTYNLSARTSIIGDMAPANDVLAKTIILSAAPAAPTVAAGGSSSLCTGGTVTLTATSATTGVTYQWFKDGVAIANATSASYIANAAGSYTVTALATGCAGPASAATVLTMNTPPIAPAVTASGPLAICVNNGSVTFTAASVTGATFTWFKNGNIIAGATSATYTATTVGSYTASATLNGCNSPTSAAKVVTTQTTPAAPSISKAGLVLTSSSTANNQWYKDGVLIPGATNRTYPVTSNGSYTVIVTTNGCSSLPSAPMNITNLGVNDDLNKIAVSVFPNPSNGLFSLSLPKGKSYQLEVSDLSGKTVLKQTSASNANLNLKNQAKGIYLLKVTTEGSTAVRKLIVE